MYPFGGSLVSALAAAYCASLISRALRQRDKRPGWLAGGVSIVAGIVIGWLCVFQLDLFTPSRWYVGKDDLPGMLVITGFVSFVVSMMPAAFVVERHQRIYDSTHAVA